MILFLQKVISGLGWGWGSDWGSGLAPVRSDSGSALVRPDLELDSDSEWGSAMESDLASGFPSEPRSEPQPGYLLLCLSRLASSAAGFAPWFAM